MKIGVYSRILDDQLHGSYAALFFEFLKKQEVEIWAHSNLKAYCENVPSVQHFNSKDEIRPDSFDFLFSLGGDGTMLDTLSIVKDSNIPVLGVNLGRFGFLANSRQEDFAQNFEDLKKGAYRIDSRSVIRIHSDQDDFDGFPYALNDFIIHKKDTSSMITVHTSLNNELLNSYWADGLILATPTGSSGYSLSCGGPIVFPGSSSFVLTAIAPHNLTVRPLIIADKEEISFKIEGRTDDFLITLDSRSYSVKMGSKLSASKANFNFNMVQFNDHSYLKTLRNKLMWGFDKRN